MGAHWLSGRMLDSRPRGRVFESLNTRHIDPSLELVQPRMTGPYITKRLMMVCKESNQINKINKLTCLFEFKIFNRTRIIDFADLIFIPVFSYTLLVCYHIRFRFQKKKLKNVCF